MVADVGATVRVLVTTTNPEGSASQASDPTATVIGAGPVNTVAPAISGTAAARLDADRHAGHAGAATGNTLRLPVAALHRRRLGRHRRRHRRRRTSSALADVGATVRVLVTATNPDGSGSRASAPTATVKAAPPVNTSVPFITGATLRGTTLTASPGTWTGPGISYAYQWQRDGVDIAGATGTTYTLRVADVGARIRVRVTATNPDAVVTAFSLASSVVLASPPRNAGVPTLSGPARLGGTLTAAPGDWTPTGLDFTYVWQRDGADIAGATSATYTLQAADVGKRVRVKVTATNVDGRRRATSAATERVAAPPVNTVAPAAPSGTPRELSTLTADAGTWDTPGVVAHLRVAALPGRRDRDRPRLRRGRRGHHVHARRRRRRPPPRRPRHRHLGRRDDHGRGRADRRRRPAHAGQRRRRPAWPATRTRGRPCAATRAAGRSRRPASRTSGGAATPTAAAPSVGDGALFTLPSARRGPHDRAGRHRDDARAERDRAAARR